MESGKFRIKAQDKTNVYPVVVTREMSPSARFVAYFVRHDGEIVADGLNFVVEEIYENKVTFLVLCLFHLVTVLLCSFSSH